MTSVFKIEIRESKEELLKLLRTQTQASKRDRLRALYLHRTGQAKNRRQMAAMLGCAESTIYRWLKIYQNQGLQGLLAVKTSPGRPRKISGQAYQDLQKQLATRRGFGSYGEIQSWLAKQHQLETAYSTVHGTVRYRIGAKLKASRPRSREADPEVQANFKINPIERVWQDLKKLFKDKNFESLNALQQQVFQEINSLTTSTLRSLTGWTYLLEIEQSLKKVQAFS